MPGISVRETAPRSSAYARSSIVEGADCEIGRHSNNPGVTIWPAETIQFGGSDANAKAIAALDLLLPPWSKDWRLAPFSRGDAFDRSTPPIPLRSRKYSTSCGPIMLCSSSVSIKVSRSSMLSEIRDKMLSGALTPNRIDS
jgi:hypothetical protein